ncbi:hypothetical protein [Salinactinospora qingdaonensis]|uniref:Uncharacterized protein n=1 Tax=Salinactinospora qingdaonensis TaxID=702744 RepID=A0ABP7FZT1_9ACTN
MAHRNRNTRYIRGFQPEGGQLAQTSNHRGRPASWVAVVLIALGFALTGIALPLWPAWWLLGAGVIAMFIGAVLSLVADIFTDVVLDKPHYAPEESHGTPLHRIKEIEREQDTEPPSAQ